MAKKLGRLLSCFAVFFMVSGMSAIQAQIQPQSQTKSSDSGLNIPQMSGRFYGTEGKWTYKFDTSFVKSFTGNSLDFKIAVACKVSGGSALGPVDSDGFYPYVIRNAHIGQIEEALKSKKDVPFVVNGFSQTSSIAENTSTLSEFYVTSARRGSFGSKKITVKLTEIWQYAGSSGKNTVTLTIGSDGRMSIKGLQNKDRSKTTGTIKLIPAAEYKFDKFYQGQ